MLLGDARHRCCGFTAGNDMHASVRRSGEPPRQTTSGLRPRHGSLEQGDQISAMWILSHCACDYQQTTKAQGFACEKSSVRVGPLLKNHSAGQPARKINPTQKC